MIAVLVVLGLMLVFVLVVVGRELLLVRRLERASGDPVEIARLLDLQHPDGFLLPDGAPTGRRRRWRR